MANNKNQHYRKNVVWNQICIFISLDGKVSSTTRPSDPPPSPPRRCHILQSGVHFRCLFIYPIMIDSVINNTHALRNQKVFAAQHFPPDLYPVRPKRLRVERGSDFTSLMMKKRDTLPRAFPIKSSQSFPLRSSCNLCRFNLKFHRKSLSPHQILKFCPSTGSKKTSKRKVFGKLQQRRKY